MLRLSECMDPHDTVWVILVMLYTTILQSRTKHLTNPSKSKPMAATAYNAGHNLCRTKVHVL